MLLGLGGFYVSARMIRYGATLLDVYTLAFFVTLYLTNRIDYIRELERRRDVSRARWHEMQRLLDDAKCNR